MGAAPPVDAVESGAPLVSVAVDELMWEVTRPPVGESVVLVILWGGVMRSVEDNEGVILGAADVSMALVPGAVSRPVVSVKVSDEATAVLRWTRVISECELGYRTGRL